MAIVVGPTIWQSCAQAVVAATALGTGIGGGFLICKAGGIGWIVSPISAEVSRSFGSINDSNTTAQAASGLTGWFVPTASQLQNPGYLCRSFWGPSPCYSNYCYWSSSTGSGGRGCYVSMVDGVAYFNPFGIGPNQSVMCARAFRCVTY